METDYKSRYESLYAKYVDVTEDLRIAEAKVEANPVTLSRRLQSKVLRQKAALRKLNRRVRVQRLQLRRLNELERGLRPEEWIALKEEFANELAEDEWDL